MRASLTEWRGGARKRASWQQHMWLRALQPICDAQTGMANEDAATGLTGCCVWMLLPGALGRANDGGAATGLTGCCGCLLCGANGFDDWLAAQV